LAIALSMRTERVLWLSKRPIRWCTRDSAAKMRPAHSARARSRASPGSTAARASASTRRAMTTPATAKPQRPTLRVSKALTWPWPS